MEKYTDLVINKIPELRFANLLYSIYSVVNLATRFDVSKFCTNCNTLFLEKVDDSATRERVTCIPLAVLRGLAARRVISAPADAPADELAEKTALFEDLRRRFPTRRDLFALRTEVPIAYCFKPWLREKVSRAADFSQYGKFSDEFSARVYDTGENEKVVPLPDKPDYEAWVSNSTVESFMAPACHGTDVTYAGQFSLACLEGGSEVGAYERFERNLMLRAVIVERVARAQTRYVAMGFAYMSHWKCLVYDRREGNVFFYDSGGSDPRDFHPYDNFYFYSFYHGFNTNRSLEPAAALTAENVDVDVLFRFFRDEFGARYGCVNVEVNQLLRSECGIFITVFMLLCVLEPPAGFKRIKRTYNFFRFAGDKKITMLKEILFNPEPFDPRTRPAETRGFREFVAMERWSADTLAKISRKISDRTKCLLNNGAAE
ncbi:ORF093 [Saltwater crocodilepox virus]|nr:virion core proteinase [Saltwater crocodilepox virus]AVD69428.1 virion core proteinase [Saltwater crocodilepox virus]QGT46532.1 ORF093 [Saltwater crocodilepox virus]QGT46748.1 ORF093 [Saltwater crocodilepox virus]QGT46964.1 ORF093 [Saltwater crocodilepox virus]